MRTTAIGAGLALALAASPALAHAGHGGPASFFEGLAHPLMGVDHVLAMVAVGLWAGIVGGRATIAWPAAFVALMTAGAVFGMSGPFVEHLELAIAGSVVALGALVALRARAPVALGAALCGAFAIAHGYAHGAELPFGADAGAYVAGFALATAALHVVGVALGLLLSREGPRWSARASGGAVALAGLLLMAA